MMQSYQIETRPLGPVDPPVRPLIDPMPAGRRLRLVASAAAQTPDEILERFLERFEGVQRHGGYYKALCPSHDDREASLAIREGDTGIVVKCHAGCETRDVVAEVGWRMRDLFYDKRPIRHRDDAEEYEPGDIIERYPYFDAQEEFVFCVDRIAPKSFRQWRRGPNGERIYRLGDDVRRIPYRLTQVLKAVEAGETIFIVEGEKDVHRLEDAGLVATCNAGGAGKWLDEWAPYFEGASVVILPDHDEPGREHGRKVAASLLPVAKEVNEPPRVL